MKFIHLPKLFISGLLYLSSISMVLGQSKLKPFYPPQHSAGEGVLCSLGKFSKCEPIKAELLRSLDECSDSIRLVGLVEDVGFLFRDVYAETFFFQELANRTVRATDCQVKILEPSQRAPLNQSGWALYSRIQPLLVILSEKRAQLQQQLDSVSLVAGTRGPSNTKARTERSKLRSQVHSIDESIDGLLSQLPFGSQKDTRDALKPLVGNANVTEEQFNSAFSSGLNSVRASLVKSQETYLKARDKKTGEYKLSTSQKINLYGTPGAQRLLDQLDPRRKSLGCMLDSCYKTGPQNARIASVVALVGATVLTAGQASPLLAAATTLGAASLSAVQIQNSCFKKTMASTVDIYNSCSAYAVANTALAQVDGVECAVDVALSSLDAVPGIVAVRRLAETRKAARGISALEKEGPKLTVTKGQSALIKLREHHYQKNLERFSNEYKASNPKASSNEVHSYAHTQAIAKQARVAELHKQCTSTKPNKSNLEAGKIFAKYSMGTSAANTLVGYSIATWDQVKDLKWASRLGYEVTSGLILSWLSSKIISGPRSFPKKVVASNLTSFVGNVADSLAYQGLFTDSSDARAEIERWAKSPTFTSDVNELLEYLNSRPQIQQYVDGVGDMANNLIRAWTGKEALKDLSAEELSQLNPESLQNPELRERLLDLVDDKLYASNKDYTTGSIGLDRLAFNTGYNLASIPVQTAIGVATFYAVCMHVDSPVKALASFGAIQFVRGNISNFTYYRTRDAVIHQ